MLKNVLILPDGTEFTAIKSCKLTDCVNDGDEFTIGSAFANIIEATLFDVGAKLSLTAGDEITLYRVADDGTRTKKGVYVLEKPTRPSANILKLIGYDYITKLDKDLTAWVNSLIGWPYELQKFAGAVCSACGLKLRLTEAIPNARFPVYKPAKANVTGRQLMRWIGEICCRFVRANADGNIELSGYTPSGVTVAPSGERYYFQGALSYETYQVAPIEAVQMRLADSENGALWPEVTESSNSYVITGNALLMARVTSDLLPFLEVIAEQLAGFAYTPCKFAMPACLDVEAGSTVEIIDKNGNRFTTCVMTKTTSGQRDTFESTGSYRRDSSTATNNQPDSTKTDGIGIKTVDVYYYLSTSSTELSGGDWSTTAPTWEDGKYIWSKTVTTYSDGSTSESTPACITGAAGQNGTDGVGVVNIVTLFYLSTSKTGLRGGAWVTTMPAWSAGYYLWTRSKITYTDGTISATAPVCDSSWEAVNELDATLDQTEVFNRLTENGTLEGLYMEEGKLYVNASYIKTGSLLASLIKAGVLQSDDGETFYLDLDNGILKMKATELSISGKTVEEISAAAAENAVAAQTQGEIFDILTNGGELQGLYMLGDQLYVNASYIKSGTIDANLVKVINLIADNVVSTKDDSTMSLNGSTLTVTSQKYGETFSLANWEDGVAYMYFTQYDANGVVGRAQFGANRMQIGGTWADPIFGVYAYPDGSVGMVLPGSPERKLSWKDNGDGTFTLIGR